MTIKKTDLETSSVDQENLKKSKRTGDFFTVTDGLTPAEFVALNTNWTEIAMFDKMEGVIDGVKDMKDTYERTKDILITNLNYAITAGEIVQILLNGLNNFLRLLVNYIYELIYNKLDDLLRLGVYSLTVIPEFQDTRGLSLPYTSLKEQAENAYKKFYDLSDTSVPYNFPRAESSTEALLSTADSIKDRLTNRFDKLKLNANSNTKVEGYEIINKIKNTMVYANEPHFKENFVAGKNRLLDIQKPGGLYDAIFLYFAFDMKNNITEIDDLLLAIAKMTAFFNVPKLANFVKQAEDKRISVKRIKVVFKRNLDMSVSDNLVAKSNGNVEYFVDESIPDYTIASMTPNGVSKTSYKILSILSKKSVNSNKMIHYSFLDRIYDSAADTETSDNIWEYEMDVQTGTFNAEDSVDSVAGDLLVEGMRIILTDSGDTYAGYIADAVDQNLSHFAEASGSWSNIQFTDLLSITDEIKTIQNWIASKKLSMTSNTFGIDNLIKTLKNIRDDILIIVAIIDALIELLDAAISFDGKIYAKYVREDDYDKMASLLTDTKNAPSASKIDFVPSKHKEIAHHITAIKKILIQNGIDLTTFEDQIDELDDKFSTTELNELEISKTSSYVTALSTNATNAVGTPSGFETATSQVIAGLVSDTKKSYQDLDHLNKTFIATVKSRIDGGVYTVSTPEQLKTFKAYRKIVYHKLQMMTILHRLSKDVSLEFGFTQIFLTYLPKDSEFFPVQHLAELLGLVDQDGNTPATQTLIDAPNVSEINSRYTTPTVEENLNKYTKSAEERNSAISPKNEESTYEITLASLYKNSSVKTLNNVESVNDGEDFVKVLSDDKSFEFLDDIKFDSSETFYGVRSIEKFDFSSIQDNLLGSEKVFKLLVDIEVEVEISSSVDRAIRTRSSQFEFYMGFLTLEGSDIFYQNNRNPVFKTGAGGTEVFKLFQQKKKRLRGECIIQTSMLTSKDFYFYLLVNYKTQGVSFDGVKFKLNNINGSDNIKLVWIR